MLNRIFKSIATSKVFTFVVLTISIVLMSSGTMANQSENSDDKVLLMIAGTPSHPPLTHEHNAGIQLLASCLEDVEGLEVRVHLNGWPENLELFEGVDAIALYMDGGGGHPVIHIERLAFMSELMAQGVSLVCIHFAVHVPAERGGAEFQDWIGGHYESNFSVNPIWDANFETLPEHPITRGVVPFSIRDEWYFNMRFRDNMDSVTPVLIAKPSDEVREGPYVSPPGPYQHIIDASGREEVLLWAVERQDGGRGVGFTGGHFHLNWGDDNFRKSILNALVWAAGLDVPESGIESSVTESDLMMNLDHKN